MKYFMKNYNKYIVLFFLLFFSKVVFSQIYGETITTILYDSTYEININSQLPPLTGIFKIIELQDGEAYSTIYNLRFINSNDNSVFCELIDTVLDFSYWPDFDLVDINFDGFKDIWTVIHRDVKAQESYKFWIFNNKQNIFEPNLEYSSLLSCNLEINPEDSTIFSGCSGGCAGRCGEGRLYKVETNHLILIEDSNTDEIFIDGKFKLQTTTRKLIDGEMKIIDIDYSD